MYRDAGPPGPKPPLERSLIELAELSPWQDRAYAGRTELLSWRTALSLALADVPFEPVAHQLWPILAEMADQVSARLSAALAEGELADGRVGFPDWLAMWREQFCSWHDPVRSLVYQQARGGTAEFLIDHLALVDGFAFTDFVLSCVVAHQTQVEFAARLRNEPRPERLLPQWVAEAHFDGRPAMSRAVTCLYARFQHFAPYSTGPAPADPIGWHDVDQIYPASPPLQPQTYESGEASS